MINAITPAHLLLLVMYDIPFEVVMNKEIAFKLQNQADWVDKPLGKVLTMVIAHSCIVKVLISPVSWRVLEVVIKMT